MPLRASRNIDSNFPSARAKFNKHSFTSSLLRGALPPPPKDTLRLTCSIATAIILLYVCISIKIFYTYITVFFRQSYTYGPLNSNYKFRLNRSYPRICGGGKSTGSKQLDEASANPWTRASGSCNPPIPLERRKVRPLASDRSPINRSMHTQEVDPCRTNSPNPWKIAMGNNSQTILAAKRRRTMVNLPEVTNNNKVDSWVINLEPSTAVGVLSGPLPNIVDNPGDTRWLKFATNSWFTHSLADDWVRLAFHRPVSCGYKSLELPSTTAFGAALFALVQSIPSYHRLEEAVRPILQSSAACSTFRSGL